jgi:hypothetical protein
MTVVHKDVSGVDAARGKVSAVIKQADRTKLGEEHDHGLSSVHKGLARPMMAWSGIGPK